MSEKMKILNLYAGIGGNRKLWEGHEVTAIEYNQDIANIYKDFFPDDSVIVADAHQYLLDHYKEYDFIWSSPPCFPANELVLTLRGHIPIKDVRVGDLVLTHKSRWKKVIKIGRKHCNVLREIKSIGIDNIKCTDNHPFYAIQNIKDNPFWVKAINLNNSHYISSPLSIEKNNYYNIFNPYLIGRWLGDGWLRIDTNKKTVFICCGKHEEKYLTNKINASGFKFIKSEEKTTFRYSLCDKNIVDFLYHNFGCTAKNKKIPGWVYGLCIKDRADILQGYLDADGHYEQKRERYNITSISRSLIYGIELLAQSLGYRCQLSKPKLKKTHVIEGRIVNQNQSYILSIKDIKKGVMRQKIVNQKIYEKVKYNKAITHNAFVYNIQVEDDKSYTVNNKIVHNCPTHSRLQVMSVLANNPQNINRKAIYPDMSLYQEIILLQNFASKKTKWVIENVIPYYNYLIEPNIILGRHPFWSNIQIDNIKIKGEKIKGKNEIQGNSSIYGYNISKYKINSNVKRKILRNLVNPEIGKYILDQAINIEDDKQLDLFEDVI